jgi:isopenicillin N synthase-like dioxygenase
MEKKFENEFIKCTFTENEKKEIAIEMAQKVANLQQAEDKKKAVASDFKSQIDGIQANVNNAATKLNNGYEMRTIKCEVIPNWKKKVWEYWRVDIGTIAKTKPMTADDLQMKLQ